MRHTANILVGQDLKLYAARLGKYILKYGEANASSYFSSLSWVYDKDGKTEIKKSVRDESVNATFVSTMQDVYETKLAEEKTLTEQDRLQDLRHFFQELHQKTVTIDNPGDSNSLLVPIYVPLYDIEACAEAINIVRTTSEIQSHYTIIIIGLCENLGSIISPEEFRNITSEEESKKKDIQKDMLRKFSELKNEQNTLEQFVVMQNTNSDGYALNLDQSSLLRIMGELALICIEKYNTIFTQATSFDKEHPLTALGLSVMNLDKYYFENYLLRRAYIRILEREDVTAEEVDLNKVAVVANKYLAEHKTIFSDFYGNVITPMWRKNIPQDTIIAQTAEQLREKLKEVEGDLISYIQDPQYSLPEKQAILAMILGYDDPLLKGNLFTEQQLTLDNLDEEVANCFIDANNACVTKVTVTSDDGSKDGIIYGPLGELCADEKGKVSLPIEDLQQIRNSIRQSTNYIREKNKELEEIKKMTDDSVTSEKRLTENGFIIDGNLYRIDVRHEEVKFDETYEAKKVTENNVDLREGFTKIKNQGQIGACTVFSIASIYEYILKKNVQTEIDLSESFVYYNVRHAEGKEYEDTGSSFQDVIKSMGEQGICTESLHPYSNSISEVPSEEAYSDGMTRRIVKALNVNIKEEDIKSAIQEGYPVAVSLKIYESFHTTKGFVERPTEEELKSADYGHHAMVVVGYADDSKLFVVRNSWGEDFGDDGYCYIPYSYICDPDLNRIACIVTEVDYSGNANIVVRGDSGKKQIVQFDTSDAYIKSCVIKNLIEEEQIKLRRMQLEDSMIRSKYETLMQTLGKQSVRTDILKSYQDILSNQVVELKRERDNINNSQRAQELQTFDKESWKTRLYTIGMIVLLILIWGTCAYLYDNFLEWLQNEWCWIILGITTLTSICLALYWWYVKSQRRRLEMELEEMTAGLSERIRRTEQQMNEQKMKMHVAGMVLDSLLSLKASLNKSYQGMKGYIGNLAVWYKEEQQKLETMEPLVKNPFIPLLSNERLNSYFEDNKEKITKGMYLYKYFENFKLDEDSIVKYKRQLKQNIIEHIKSLLDGFTIFRHIFATRDYLYLDNEYASAENLLPMLDSKSVPFCQVKRSALTKSQARFMFIHTDADEEQAWRTEYPKYFNTTPISENIVSIFKIIGLRLQALQYDEIVLD